MRVETRAGGPGDLPAFAARLTMGAREASARPLENVRD